MTTEECKALLADARTQYHALKTGRMARVIVDQNGQRVEFQSTNMTGLYNYIQELEAQCPSCTVDGMAVRPRGPLGFFF